MLILAAILLSLLATSSLPTPADQVQALRDICTTNKPAAWASSTNSWTTCDAYIVDPVCGQALSNVDKVVCASGKIVELSVPVQDFAASSSPLVLLY